MLQLPLRKVSITNFRRLAGTLEIELDAPIVLIHGQNGTGKTSILSAIELALTGGVKSLDRVDSRYTANLPHHGQTFATVGVSVADLDGGVHPTNVVTAAGNEIKGEPALSRSLAQFYSERCYLDQVSLGRLLELYQTIDANKETSLARFVNELLGLDQLDSLRSGLEPATHKAKFKKQFPWTASTIEDRKAVTTQRKTLASKLTALDQQLPVATKQLQQALSDLGHEGAEPPTAENLQAHSQSATRILKSDEFASASQLVQAASRLRGRIDALLSRPPGMPTEVASGEQLRASAALTSWQESDGVTLSRVRDAVASLGIEGPATLTDQMQAEIDRIANLETKQSQLLNEQAEAIALAASLAETIETIDTQLSNSERRAGSFATALAALRERVSDDICPVCDRDYNELSSGHLLDHIERKIGEITTEGQQIGALSEQKVDAKRQLQAAERNLKEIHKGILPDADLVRIRDRKEKLTELAVELGDLGESVAEGARLRQDAQLADQAVVDIRNLDRERLAVEDLLSDLAEALRVPSQTDSESIEAAWTRLYGHAAKRQADALERRDFAQRVTSLVAEITTTQQAREAMAVEIASLAQTEQTLEDQANETERRRLVAYSVHTAATTTRDRIVERVFTDSLNKTWRDVFSRLAPNEPFTPAFGIPKSTTRALSLEIETIHRSGDRAGTPAGMLSSGNLNTAALSLFVALHLAGPPNFPCLVFDDPIQSMDEVHISQFAGLLRVLSKNHGRQIVIAVHERELYKYLALELSPAFNGDRLITVELGTNDGGLAEAKTAVHEWQPDSALAS